jgi:hypothetical protein
LHAGLQEVMQAFASEGPEAAEQVLAEFEAARPKLQDAMREIAAKN